MFFDVIFPIILVLAVLLVGWTVLRKPRPRKPPRMTQPYPGSETFASYYPPDPSFEKRMGPPPYKSASAPVRRKLYPHAQTGYAPSSKYPNPVRTHEANARARRDGFFYGLPATELPGGYEIPQRELEAQEARYKSGLGGDFAGGGASGGWDDPVPTLRDAVAAVNAVHKPWVNPVTDVGVCRRDEETAPAYFSPAPSPSPAPAVCAPTAPAPSPSGSD